ncbi:N-acetylmuramoyl-L-alanine amidase [Parvibaculum indicum]|uniref:N-acetylmuramoyl-L-alanine amidase n=1 Tax=Parvibaculum indicum TaxID=562969 RepID=UPI00141FA2FF|nr:N-acetylmuramoyl-L-alanine amidase [Parvibaculum indicum]NIJ42622.1 N-acetylmuramoyl-L-alanine amidase [Parvibaculum indicum]
MSSGRPNRLEGAETGRLCAASRFFLSALLLVAFQFLSPVPASAEKPVPLPAPQSQAAAPGQAGLDSDELRNLVLGALKEAEADPGDTPVRDTALPDPQTSPVTQPAPTAARSDGPVGAITNARLGDHGRETRFVLELNGADPVVYEISTVSNPYRLVIDLQHVDFRLPEGTGKQAVGVVSGFRYGRFGDDSSRIVLDLTGPAVVDRKFELEPQAGFGRRIVLDIASTDAGTFAAQNRPDDDAAAVAALPDTMIPIERPAAGVIGRRVVVIDPGHGGVDPGTIGRSGVKEKDVVLAFAKEFADQLRATGRYDVRLTRSTDRFIKLRQRVAIARQYNADLFVSIHANSISKPSVRGLSVYTLSETASDKEAAALARKENASDIIAGVDLGGESPEVTGILIDLAQRETKNFSSRFARSLVDYASAQTHMLRKSHRFAGFAVLKAPDVPSVLVELGFLTNSGDERELTSSSWRKKVSRSFVKAVDRYFGERLAEAPE